MVICFKGKRLIIYELLKVNGFTPVKSVALNQYGLRRCKNKEV